MQSADKFQDVKKRGKARQVNPEKTMTGVYTYAVFDENFRPYDAFLDIMTPSSARCGTPVAHCTLPRNFLVGVYQNDD